MILVLRRSIRSVRIEAALLLAGSVHELSQPQKAALNSAVLERIESEMISAERPESHMNLGLLYTRMGRTNDAEYELQTALRLDPNYVPALVNLADLYRIQRRETEAQQFLERAIAVSPNAAEPIHALGLLKVRLGRQHEALDLFAKAAMLQPGTTRYAYVYGVALHSYGEVEKAITVLKDAYERRPADRDVLTALIAFQRDKGDIRAAFTYAEKLVQLNPDDVQAIASEQPQRKTLKGGWKRIFVILALVIGKWIAAQIGGRLFGYSPNASKTMWSLTLPQVAATLAATLVAFDTFNPAGERLIDRELLNVVLVLMLTTSILGPVLTERFAPRMLEDEAESPLHQKSA